MSKIRTRFAPSPTGFMHIGNFRSALYDYLFSKKNNGDFILRIEDTDQKRFVPNALESIIKVLEWSNLEYSEGVFKQDKIKDKKIKKIESKNYPEIFEAGDFAPYIQSEKLEIYKKYADELVAKGYAYYCFCEPERLEEMRKEQTAQKKAPIYDQYCLRNLSKEEINEKLKSNCPHTIRLKMPKDETIELDDIIRGKVKFETNLIDDQILIKSDGFPTYHLANVVDDHEMEITHVIRGEEWLPSAPKHLILYRYFDWEAPKFAHLPLLLNSDKSKLSKRQGDVAVEDYIEKGYLKEAIINFVAFLGWNPGKGETEEIFSLEELVQKFELARVHKAGAVFDLKKLDWINSEWLKKISLDDLYSRALKFLEKKDFFQNAPEEKKSKDFVKKLLTIERTRLSKLTEVGESNKFFFENINYDKNLLYWKEMKDEELKKNLEKANDILNEISEPDWKLENLEKALMEAAGENRGNFLWPIRAALSGAQKSPSPFECAWVLGKNESLKRITEAIKKI